MSAAPDSPLRAKPAAATLATSNAPSVKVPLAFVLTGVASLLTGVVWLVFRPDVLATYHYNQYVIAITHVFTLGFISTIIMGAMYQLVPVALETHLFSERLAKWHFALHLVGIVGTVAMFWVWNMKQVGHFGSSIFFGVVLFAINIGRTLRRVPRWNLIATGVASATGWLVLTVLAGLWIASAKCWDLNYFEPIPQMHAHAHLGAVGFFTLLIVTVSYKLVPMFALSDVKNERRATWSIRLLNIGLAGLFVTMLLASPWKLLFASVVTAALLLYAVELRAILHARKRRQLDLGLKTFLIALGLLVPVSCLGLVLAWPGLPATTLTTQLENVYGFLFLAGVVALAIMGMLHKIVPFLAWYHSYSREIGRSKVPALADLYCERLQFVSLALYLAGLAVTTVATAIQHEPVVRIGCVLLSAGVVLFVANMGLILRHFFAPRLEPLVLPVKKSQPVSV